MNVSCPNCATVYRVDPAKVPEGGVRARCSICSAVFAVGREAEARAAAAGTAGSSPAASAGQTAPGTPAAAATPPAPPAPTPSMPPPTAAAPAPMPSSPRADQPRSVPPAPVMPAAPPPAAAVPPGPASRPTNFPPPAVPAAAPRPAMPPAAPMPPAPAMSRAAAAAPPPPAAPPPAPAPPQAPAPVKPTAVTGSRPVNPFLSQDPALKARRLARALISDMVVYHPAKRQEGLRDGNLKQLFDEEIRKSWEEYAEQVGKDVADSTPYFKEALNEILAGGRQIF
jgi:predicted Zn finger-like uncharacterized protein